MPAKPARNYYNNRDGYVVCRFICKNAPTNRVRPISLLNGHKYEVYAYGNGAGSRWMEHLRSKTCPRCGKKMVPINQWVPSEQPVVDEPQPLPVPSPKRARRRNKELQPQLGL